jgi:hypothetical protein
MRVPIIDDQRIQTAPIQGGQLKVEAPIEAFGGGQIAEQQAKAVDTVSKETAKVLDRWNEISVDEEDNELSKKQQELTLKQSSARGADAMRVSEEIRKEWQDEIDKRRKNLTGNYQRAAFDKKLAARNLKFNTDIEQHVSAESLKHEEEVFKASIINAENEAVLKYSDQKRVEDSLIEQQLQIDKFALANGKSPEWVKQNTMANNSAIHEKVIDRFLAENNPDKAKAHYEKYKDSIIDPDSKLFKLVNEGIELTKVQAATDDIFSRGLSYEDALAEVRKNFEGKQEADIIKGLKERFNEKEEGIKIAAIATFDPIMDELETTKGNYTPPMNEWLRLNPQQRKSFDARKEELLGGKYVQTDYARYYDLVEMALDERTEKNFLNLDLNAEGAKMNKREINKLLDLKVKITTANKQTRTAIDKSRSTKDVAEYTMVKSGIDPTKPAGKKIVGEFIDVLGKAVLDYEVATGNPAPAEKQQELADALNREYLTGKKFFGMFDKKEKGFKVKVPEEDRKKIIESFIRQKKRAPNESEIIDTYSKKLSKKQEEPKVQEPSIDYYRKTK